MSRFTRKFWDWFATTMTAATGRPWVNPKWVDDTATCAAECGLPVPLGEPHYAVVRTVERVEADGTVAPSDGDELAYLHIDCWPGEQVTLRAVVGGPDQAAVTS